MAKKPQNYSVSEEDYAILQRLREAEEKVNFKQKEYAVVHYQLQTSVSINATNEKLLRALKLAKIQDCNTLYAEILGVKKSDLVNKVTLDDRLPNNFVNYVLFQKFVENKFRIDGVESLEYDIHGNETWFINHVFLEIKENQITGIWARKRDITHQKKMIYHTLDSMGLMLEKRDLYTSLHQKRVAKLSRAIALKYGLTLDKISFLELAATVHDIGKISVPAEILSKPDKLTSVEYDLVKIHPEVGYKILKDLDDIGIVAEIVYQHHERLDGSGYPRGLKDEDILLETKIMAVADTVESMVSHRPYRPAFPLEYVMNEIKNLSGTKLDPRAVEICVKLFEKGNFFDH